MLKQQLKISGCINAIGYIVCFAHNINIKIVYAFIGMW